MSSDRGHTPGPWRFGPKLTWSENDRGFAVSAAGQRGHIADVSPRIRIRGDASAEGLANAYLITAAPDLLAALVEAADEYEHAIGYAGDYFRDKWDMDAALKRMRAAIAKATPPTSDQHLLKP